MRFLAQRDVMPERMDDPGCCVKRLLRTVDQFALINRLFSRYRTILTRYVLDVMARDPGRTYRLTDLGAGGCDIAVWLLHAARQRGLQLEIRALEPDPRIAKHVRNRLGRVDGLHIEESDALDGDAVRETDFVFANHFLHHLGDPAIERLLALWTPRTRYALLLSDLRRDPISYVGYGLFASFLGGSFARVDGLHSIRRGFQPDELQSLADRAGVEARVDRFAPGRLLLRVRGTAASVGVDEVRDVA